MEHLFLTVLNMSLTASYIILAVLLLRLCLRRAPKKYSYALWGVVGFRLLCPFSFSSVFSLFSLRPFDMTAAQAAGGAALTYLPQDLALMETPQVTTGLPFLNAALNPSLPAAAPAASANPLQIWLFVGAVVWLVGVCGFLLYALLSALRLRRALRSAVRYEGDPTGRVYCSEAVASPFLFGLFRPRIYLPYGLSKEAAAHVLSHERCHLKRSDHLWRLLGYLLLALHWFNPLVHLAFACLTRDMEQSCDEAVLAKDPGLRKEYCSTLLALSCRRRLPTPSPLAFGESGVKGRIKNALRCHKPKAYVTAIAAAVTALGLAACAANPAPPASTAAEGVYQNEHVLYAAPYLSFSYAPGTPRFALELSEGGELRIAYDVLTPDSQEDWVALGALEPVELTEENFDARFESFGFAEDASAAKNLRKNNAKAFGVTTESGKTYTLLQQTDGTLLMAVGNNGEGSPIHWLFELGVVGDVTCTAQSGDITSPVVGSWTPAGEETAGGGLPVSSLDPTITSLDGTLPWVLFFESSADTLTVEETLYLQQGDTEPVAETTWTLNRHTDGLSMVVTPEEEGVTYATYRVTSSEGELCFALYFAPQALEGPAATDAAQ